MVVAQHSILSTMTFSEDGVDGGQDKEGNAPGLGTTTAIIPFIPRPIHSSPPMEVCIPLVGDEVRV